MQYTTGKTAEIVCEHLAWMASIHPIKAFARGITIYATGTLLKPEEWRELRRHNGDTLPDGRTLKITHIPTTL